MTDTPNPAEEAPQDAPPANPADAPAGTEQTPADDQGKPQEPAPVDYQTKFSESSREAQRLLEENKRKDEEKKLLEEENARLRALADQGPSDTPADTYPGFDLLSEDEQRNILEFQRVTADQAARKATEALLADPAIGFARETYAEKTWEQAFEQVATQFPALRASKDEFKAKTFSPHNTPANLAQILTDLAKVHLFDKAKELGAAEERERTERIDQERGQGGAPAEVAPHRTLEDWQALQRSNPAKFASLSKEYDEDLKSGRLGE